MSARDPSPAHLLDRRYRLLQVVAHGSLGRVYRARHVGLDAMVALKELRPPAQVADETCEAARSRFFREARALTTLSHPNLPRVHDYFSHGRACFLVMDFIEGEPLAVHARRLGRLPLDEVLGYGLQLCEALAYLHRQRPPLYLGTISLSDIIITHEGRPVLADLGVAHRFARALQTGDQADASARQPDAGGAPASADGDIRAEVLSLGAALREMLVGVDPAVALGHPTPSHELDPRTYVGMGTALDPFLNQHFATIEEMGQALRTAARQLMPVPGAAPSTAGLLGTDDVQVTMPASLPFSLEPLLEPARVAAPRPGTGADGGFADDDVYRAPSAARPFASTRSRWPDRKAPPAAGRRRGRAIGALATSALALAAATALALALSLSAGSSPTVTAGSHAAMGVSGTQVAPSPAPQRAASQLGGPPSNANPPDKQFIRLSPPTPTPRPTATPHPTRRSTPLPTTTPDPVPTPTITPGPIPTPTITPSSPCSTPTVPAYPSDTPTVAPSPTAAPETSLSPAATATDVSGSGGASQPTGDSGGMWHAAPGVVLAPDAASSSLSYSSPRSPLAAWQVSASPMAGHDPSCARGARDDKPLPSGAGAGAYRSPRSVIYSPSGELAPPADEGPSSPLRVWSRSARD